MRSEKRIRWMSQTVNNAIESYILMTTLLTIFQIIISILLATTILLQQRGGGLSPTFGGSGALYGTRRGMEKTIFWATIILAILFFSTALASIFIK